MSDDNFKFFTQLKEYNLLCKSKVFFLKTHKHVTIKINKLNWNIRLPQPKLDNRIQFDQESIFFNSGHVSSQTNFTVCM